MRYALLSTLLSLIFSAGAALAQTAPAPARTITVTASEEVEATPDQAELRFDLVSENRDLTTAKTQNDQMVERLLTVTKEFSIPRDKVVTSNLYVQPEYDYKPENQRTLRGYRVSRSMALTVTPLDAYEKVIAKLVASGVDHVGGIQFTLANPDGAESAAREKALAKARKKAESMTATLGVRLGKVVTVIENGAINLQPPMPMMLKRSGMDAMAAESAPPPLPGKVQVSQSVTLTYEIE